MIRSKRWVSSFVLTSAAHVRPHSPLRAFVSSSRRMTTGDTGLQFRSESREMRLVSRLSGCSFYVTGRATARMRGRGIPLRVTTHRPSGLCCSVLESRMWGDRELPWGEEQFFVSLCERAHCRVRLCVGEGGREHLKPPSPEGECRVTTADWKHAFTRVLTVWMQLWREGKMCKQNGTACKHMSVCLTLRICSLYIWTRLVKKQKHTQRKPWWLLKYHFKYG